MDNGIIEAGIPLNFGIRIGHFSFLGEKNVFFEQPEDMSAFTTEKGWRIRGGHRLWVAPEREEDYCPDNEPIEYRVISEEEVELVQKPDPWLKAVKSFRISMDGDRLRVTHKLTNLGEEKLGCSLWAITVMAPGGVETIKLPRREGGMSHWHRVSLWDYTDLGDPRAQYGLDEIKIRHLPIDKRYKIGVGHPLGPVCYENDGVIFQKEYEIRQEENYPDGNVSYETFFSQYMAEMESLSPYRELLPGENAEHSEIWKLTRAE